MAATVLVNEPPGAAACSLLRKAIDEATLMQPGVTEAIAAASTAAGQPVAAAGGRLAAAYSAAVAARDTAGEPDAVAAVSAAGAEMKTLCAEAGLETAG
jgi:anti-sigma factor RsiW